TQGVRAHDTMPRFLEQFAKGLGKAVVAMVLVFGAFLLYISHSERTAADKADEFCGSVESGDTATGLREQALTLGANDHHTRWFKTSDGIDQLPVTFPGATPLSRHICWLTAKDGQVTSKHLTYLD